MGEYKFRNHSDLTLSDAGNFPVNHPARGKKPGLVLCSVLAAGLLILPTWRGEPHPGLPGGVLAPSVLEEGAGSATRSVLL